MSSGKKKMPIGRRFKKGQSGNPLGGAIVAPEVRAVMAMSRKEISEVATTIMRMTRREIEALAKNPDATMIQSMVAALAAKTIQKGDSQAFDKLMDRLVGKAKEHIEVGGIGGGPIKSQLTPSQIADPELFAQMCAIEEKLKAKRDSDK